MSRRLTIYTDKYDSQEDVCGNGMSGKVFLDIMEGNSDIGQEFKSIDEAMDYFMEQGINVDSLDFMYLSKDGSQRFIRFCIK